MLPYPRNEIAGHAEVKGAVAAAGEEIDAGVPGHGCFLLEAGGAWFFTGRRWIADVAGQGWIPAFAGMTTAIAAACHTPLVDSRVRGNDVTNHPAPPVDSRFRGDDGGGRAVRHPR